VEGAGSVGGSPPLHRPPSCAWPVWLSSVWAGAARRARGDAHSNNGPQGQDACSCRVHAIQQPPRDRNNHQLHEHTAPQPLYMLVPPLDVLGCVPTCCAPDASFAEPCVHPPHQTLGSAMVAAISLQGMQLVLRDVGSTRVVLLHQRTVDEQQSDNVVK
jgi:hypothetical protein